MKKLSLVIVTMLLFVSCAHTNISEKRSCQILYAGTIRYIHSKYDKYTSTRNEMEEKLEQVHAKCRDGEEVRIRELQDGSKIFANCLTSAIGTGLGAATGAYVYTPSYSTWTGSWVYVLE